MQQQKDGASHTAISNMIWRLLQKQKKGKENYYVNVQLVELFMTYNDNPQQSKTDNIESIHVTKSNRM